MKQTHLQSASYMAEQKAALSHDRRRFNLVPEIKSLTLRSADGEEATLDVDALPAFATGRHCFLNTVLRMVQRQLKRERQMLKKQVRDL